MRNFLLLLSCAVSSVLAQGSETETQRLHQWLDARYEEELAFSPMSLTTLGRKTNYDQIDDYSEVAVDEELSWQEQSVLNMERVFDYQALDAEGKTSYDFWRYRYEIAKQARAYFRHNYAMDQFNGRHTYFAEFLLNYHKVDDAADMRAYIARIGASARALGQLLQRAKVAAAEGIRPPRFSYDYVIAQSNNLIQGYPFPAQRAQLEGNSSALQSSRDSVKSSVLWRDISAKLDVLVAAGKISADQRRDLESAAKHALLEAWLPAYQTVIAWYQADLAHADNEAKGVHALPNGAAYYRHRLALNTHSELTPEEVHQLGLAEVARIRGELEAIKESVGFAGSLQAFFTFVRDDAQFYFPDTDEGRAAYIEKTEKLLATMQQRLPDYFGLLPRTPLVVKRVESFREIPGAAAFYNEGTADGARPGVYYLHLADMTAMSSIDLETTAYHEGNPGHHMQVSIALERGDLPLFRQHTWYSAYGEGWALYSEYLAKEMGAFADPYADFGRLVNEIWRAIRLVVDTGIHAKGWSQEQAVTYMMDNSSIPLTTVESEVQRYLVSPGQASSYKTGMLKLLQMRAAAKQQLGERFDIRAFHDIVLGGGSLPMPLLQRRIDQWVAEQATP